MRATKTFLAILGIIAVLSAWTVAHSVLWEWLLPDGGLWKLGGSMLTSIILPGLGWALYSDLRALASGADR